MAPAADPRGPEARRLSTHGEELLDRCRVVADLGEAVADCVFVAATSARVGGVMRRQTVGTPEEVLAPPRRRDDGGADGDRLRPRGRRPDERRGLALPLSSSTSRPTRAYPVLNLAQAVAVCLYELRRQWLRRQGAPVRR